MNHSSWDLAFLIMSNAFILFIIQVGFRVIRSRKSLFFFHASVSLVNCSEMGPKHSAFLEGDFQRLYGIGINFSGKCELNSKFNAMRILNGELRS